LIGRRRTLMPALAVAVLVQPLRAPGMAAATAG
jgi:hypothetical protein